MKGYEQITNYTIYESQDMYQEKVDDETKLATPPFKSALDELIDDIKLEERLGGKNEST